MCRSSKRKYSFKLHPGKPSLVITKEQAELGSSAGDRDYFIKRGWGNIISGRFQDQAKINICVNCFQNRWSWLRSGDWTKTYAALSCAVFTAPWLLESGRNQAVGSHFFVKWSSKKAFQQVLRQMFYLSAFFQSHISNPCLLIFLTAFFWLLLFLLLLLFATSLSRQLHILWANQSLSLTFGFAFSSVIFIWLRK